MDVKLHWILSNSITLTFYIETGTSHNNWQRRGRAVQGLNHHIYLQVTAHGNYHNNFHNNPHDNNPGGMLDDGIYDVSSNQQQLREIGQSLNVGLKD